MLRAGIAACLAAFVSMASAQDRVMLRFHPAYPLPGESVARMEARVERTYASPAPRAQDIDRYFDAVRAELAGQRIAADWQDVVPHAPSIEVTVEVDGRIIRLASSRTDVEGRDEARRHRLALERIVTLTLDMLRTTASGR